MKQYKFRAWDGSRMLNRTLFDRNWYDEEDKCVKRAMPRDSNTLEVMQFTGLKDKNGNPVYEGDIVLNEDFVGNPDCVNKWEREVTWDDTNAAWAGIEGEVVTVLGNIHQHPHLLP